jgi:leader peptidase (prepilin peptidase)/N-methyltransferase
MMSEYFPWVFASFGFFIGSFGNVVLYRLRHGGSLVFSRSSCPSCSHTLGAKDLIPLFSFLFLQGKCRYCSAKISWQYPIIELLTGILWIFLVWRLPFPETLFDWDSYLLVFWVMVSLLWISVYDILYREIPDALSIPSIGLTGFMMYTDILPSYSSGILASIGVYSFFYLQVLLPAFLYAWKTKKFQVLWNSIKEYFLFPVWIFFNIFLPQKLVDSFSLFQNTEEDIEEVPVWIGGGDLRLAFLMGFLLGGEGSFIALLIAYFSGSIFGISKKLFFSSKDSYIAFGPFLALGMFLSFFWGNEIFEWYMGVINGEF